jgi:hypothetical protein
MLKIIEISSTFLVIMTAIIFLFSLKNYTRVSSTLFFKLMKSIFILDVLSLTIFIICNYFTYISKKLLLQITFQIYPIIEFFLFVSIFLIFAKNKFFYKIFNILSIMVIVIASVLNTFFGVKIFLYTFFISLLFYCLMYIYFQVKYIELDKSLNTESSLFYCIGVSVPVLLALPFIPISYYMKTGDLLTLNYVAIILNRFSMIVMYFFFYKSIKSYTWTEK